MNDQGALVRQNELLASLGTEALAEVMAGSTIVELELGGLIHQVDERSDHVWFPLSGMVSLTVPLKDGTSVEAGVIGREGVVGLSSLLGKSGSADEAIVQLPGKACRIGCAAFRGIMIQHEEVMLAILGVSHDLFLLVSQSAACNVRHGIAQRLARWILLAHDRFNGDVLPLTQEFLGNMLGVQRTSITTAAQELQQRGAISYSRGKLAVLNRMLLEELCCECYAAVQERLVRPLRKAHDGH
jgi:CRP-like cAMP-binding protein